MALHKLIMDDIFEDMSCSLIAIHTSIEDYRLAYILNRYLNISLKRKEKDLDFNNGLTQYSIYEWKNNRQRLVWNLVSNICKVETTTRVDYDSLFEKQQKIVKTYSLIPELNNVNYFLKVDNELTKDKEKNIINSLLKISQITTAYTVNVGQLKSKENLIFN